jgi:solute carrier family 25 oxoglutarate transporter 11
MNSGWSANFGGFEYSYYRKIPTFFIPFVITSPLGVIYDMTDRAFKADKSFPKELQKGYTSFFDTLRRIPLE